MAARKGKVWQGCIASWSPTPLARLGSPGHEEPNEGRGRFSDVAVRHTAVRLSNVTAPDGLAHLDDHADERPRPGHRPLPSPRCREVVDETVAVPTAQPLPVPGRDAVAAQGDPGPGQVRGFEQGRRPGRAD